MICLDTTFLIDFWRNRRQSDHYTSQFLATHDGENLVAPVPAIGEFLEGSAFVSPGRLEESKEFILSFTVGELNFETAHCYAEIVSAMRRVGDLPKASDFDLWIAAWAVQHEARLATRNVRHFEKVPGLELLAY